MSCCCSRRADEHGAVGFGAVRECGGDPVSVGARCERGERLTPVDIEALREQLAELRPDHPLARAGRNDVSRLQCFEV